MSFKIFSLQLAGKIKPVEKIEKQREALQKNYQEFLRVDKSEELQEYLELESFINSSGFKKKMAEIEALQFKGSKEFKQLVEFKKLNKAKRIKNYFKIAGSFDLKRFEDLKKSDKLKEYDQLEEYVKEGQFQKEKKEIKGCVYKGSVEEQHAKDLKRLGKLPGIKAYLELFESDNLKEHEKFAASEKLKKYYEYKNAPEPDKEKSREFAILKKDREINLYFKTENSKKLKLYRETVDSHDLKRYNELKIYTEKREFTERVVYLKDKKKLEKSEAFKKYQEYKSLRNDADIKYYLKFEKSPLYKNYLDVKNSEDLKRYNELKEITASNEFMERKAYLEDKNKWEKTEEYGKLKKYGEIKKQPHIQNYFKYKSSADFDFLKNWEVTFEDGFAARLNPGKWSTVNKWADKIIGENYSLPGDLHCFTSGENIKTGGKLTIGVKKESAKGKIWKMQAGFIPADFEYTSGLVSSVESFGSEDGIFEAKIMFNPVKQLVSSLYLSGENNTPMVHLLEMGAKNRLGISKLDGNGKIQMEGLDISNLKAGKWYIFSVEKSGPTFIWRINETEVFRMNKSEGKTPMYINASSIVIDDLPGHQLPSTFEIEWIKCFRKKKG